MFLIFLERIVVGIFYTEFSIYRTYIYIIIAHLFSSQALIVLQHMRTNDNNNDNNDGYNTNNNHLSIGMYKML